MSVLHDLLQADVRNSIGINRRRGEEWTRAAFLDEHRRRGLPPDTLLEGLQVRRSIPAPDELTDSPEQRAAKALRRAAGERKWTPWKTISGWRVSSCRLCDLGPVWTENTEYRRA